MKTRKNIMNEFNINYNCVKSLEQELKLFDKSDLKNKKYTKEQYEKIKNLIINKYSLPKDAVQIKDSYDFVTPKGYIYKRKGNTGLYLKAKFSIIYGYCYCTINYINGKRITKRVHRIVAETFVPNPNNYPIVMHINNNKQYNDASNLKWGTISENTKQAYDDNLAVNKKGYEDSQSFPVSMFTKDGKYIKSFGSIIIASKETNISKSTIARHCKKQIIPRKHNVYFRYQIKD